MAVPYYIVDAFTHGRTGGNPAAVCLLHEPMDPEEMQTVAAGLQLSETAFVYREVDNFNLRWFTPKTEVELCGHATLAAAHILWETGRLSTGMPATFETPGGKLSAVRSGTWIKLDFPALAVKEAQLPQALINGVGVTPIFTGRSRFDALIVVQTEDEVLAAAPDFAALAQIRDLRGVMLTAVSRSPAYDFVSRFFAPAIGIDEDPVTGSAHCCLGPYWASKLGRDELVGCQASRRGGIVRVRVEPNRVELAGQAVTVSSGVTA